MDRTRRLQQGLALGLIALTMVSLPVLHALRQAAVARFYPRPADTPSVPLEELNSSDFPSPLLLHSAAKIRSDIMLDNRRVAELLVSELKGQAFVVLRWLKPLPSETFSDCSLLLAQTNLSQAVLPLGSQPGVFFVGDILTAAQPAQEVRYGPFSPGQIFGAGDHSPKYAVIVRQLDARRISVSPFHP